MPEVLLPIAPSASAQARLAASRWIPDHPRQEDVMLALSELVNNVVEHAGLDPDSGLDPDAGVRVRMSATGRAVRFEITYPAVVASPRAKMPKQYGRGLDIVDTVVDDWGVESFDAYTMDWFEIEWRQESW